MAKTTKYTVNDGKLILTLEPMEEGGYLVRSPMDPEILASRQDCQRSVREGVRRSQVFDCQPSGVGEEETPQSRRLIISSSAGESKAVCRSRATIVG